MEIVPDLDFNFTKCIFIHRGGWNCAGGDNASAGVELKDIFNEGGRDEGNAAAAFMWVRLSRD